MTENSKIKACVVLSTFNGEKYLGKQLDSILQQSGIDLSLLVRDDGSSDRTLEIIQEYSLRFPNIKIVLNSLKDNLGISKSYLFLMEVAMEESFDYLVFSDQDDVWPMHRLNFLETLAPSLIPTLYSGLSKIVDVNLKPIGDSRKINKPIRFIDVPFGNSVSGNTMVLNRPLVGKILDVNRQWVDIFLHDYFALVVALFYGVHAPRNEFLTYYRQHSSNAIGYQLVSRIRIAKVLSRRKQIYSYSWKSGLQFILSYFHETDSNKAKDIKAFIRLRDLGLFGRVFFIFVIKPRRQTFFETVWIRIKIIFLMN